MDTISLTSFLLTGFALWRQETSNSDTSDFIRYIKDEALPTFEQQLTDNHELLDATNKLVLEDTRKIKQGIDELNQLILEMAARGEVFSGFVHALGYEPKLSKQGISILKQFLESGASELREFRNADSAMPTSRYILLGVQADLRIDDAQFIDDDFDTLVEMGLLRDIGTDNRGNRKYKITRQAQRFINGISEESFEPK